MKKIFLSLFLALIFALSSCTVSTPQNSVSDTESLTESTGMEDPPNPQNVRLEFEMNVIRTTEIDNAPGLLDVECITTFDNSPCTDHEAEETLQRTILGVPYTLVYQRSLILGLFGTHLHEYRLEEVQRLGAPATVWIHAETNEILKYGFVPYNMKLTTEEGFVEFVKNIIGDSYGLEQFSYQPSTWYFQEGFYQNGTPFTRSAVVDGFYICKENEYVHSYMFSFRKTVGDKKIKTSEAVSAEFYVENQELYMEIYNLGDYEKSTFSNILESWEQFELSMEEYIYSNLHSQILAIDVITFDHKLLIKDGQLYIRTFVHTEVDTKYASGYPTGVDIVTKIIEIPK